MDEDEDLRRTATELQKCTGEKNDLEINLVVKGILAAGESERKRGKKSEF